jgi:proteasome accessory factor C
MKAPPPSEGGRTLAYERLRRLLFLVPYISKHQGKTVDEVAKAVDMSRSALLQELELLTLVGRPPFQPDDLIDVYVEDDRVYIDLDQRLSAPPRLTVAEGVALAATAALLKPAAGGTLASALAKLETVLPPVGLERYREILRRLDVSSSGPDSMSVLAQAIAERLEVRFEYLGIDRGTREVRHVRPKELFSHRGQWYLSGFCLTRNEDRLFRVDRISAPERLATHFDATVPSGRSSLPASGPWERPVQVRFSKALAPYQLERFGSAAKVERDGTLVVTVPGDSLPWLCRWVLSFGGEATVLSPPWAVTAIADAAQRLFD